MVVDVNYSYIIVIMYIVVYFHLVEYCSFKIGTRKRNYLWSVLHLVESILRNSYFRLIF